MLRCILQIFDVGSFKPIGVKEPTVPGAPEKPEFWRVPSCLSCSRPNGRKPPRVFSRASWSRAPGKWIVLAGQTGGDEKGEYQTDMAVQVGTALKRIVKAARRGPAAGPRAYRSPGTWYLTSKSEYEAAGAGIGAAWKETLGRNFPAPRQLLYISGPGSIRRAKGRDRSHGHSCRRNSLKQVQEKEMTQRSTSADFVHRLRHRAGRKNQPDIMVLSLTTAKGVHDFALNKEQALLIAKNQ